MDHEEYKGLISRKYWVSHILQMSKILLMFSFGAVMLLHLATLCLGQEVQANDSNRAFSVPSPMIFSTSSPSATTGGGQSNSPVCPCSFFDPRILSVHFPCFSFCVLDLVSLVIRHFCPYHVSVRTSATGVLGHFQCTAVPQKISPFLIVTITNHDNIAIPQHHNHGYDGC
jgi:hypothetical protein